MTYKVTLTLDSGIEKVFTDFDNEQDAQEFCIKCGTQGVFFNSPNDGESFYYPPHRIRIMQVVKDEGGNS